ncbi:MAG TPA: hypothetical protein VFV38_04650, partial [Ktedonobacteraceae bacterium]|nr:hypothetical protein [Ktedonobacteraceae bacterium]
LEEAWGTLQPTLFTWHMNMYLTQASLLLAERERDESAKSGLRAWKLAKTIHSHKGEVEVHRLLDCLLQGNEITSPIRELMLQTGERA